MKFYTVLFFTFISSLFFAQEETKLADLIDEFTLSVNLTDEKNTTISDGIGFGVGIFHTWRDSSRINLLSGISYNYTNQFNNLISLGHSSSYSDAQIAIHSISIPFILRCNFGKRTKIFVETGVFVGVNPKYGINGILHIDNQENRVVKNKVSGGNDAGFLLALGTSIPIRKQAILVKFGYQFGFGGKDIGRETIYNHFASVTVGYKLNKN